MHTNKFSIGGLIGVHVSSIVNEAIRTNLEQFQTFLREIFATQKTQNKQKPTNKLKLSKY